MKKLILGIALLLSFPTVSLAEVITLEPQQSPPINAGDRYIRAEAYSTQAVYVKGGILVSIKEALTPENTYLPDYSGTSRSLLVEMDCQTGKGILTGINQNDAVIPVKQQLVDLLKNPYHPYALAISLACKFSRD